MIFGNLSCENSSLGTPCGDFGNLERFADAPVQSHAPNSQKTPQLPPQILELDSNKSDSSKSKDFCDSKNDKNQIVRSATESRPIRGAKNRIQTSSSASADFLLESDKRGTPPKSEKRQLLGIHLNNSWGEREQGGAALLRKETSESKSKKIVGNLKVAKMDCHEPLRNFHNDESFFRLPRFGVAESYNDSIHLRIELLAISHHLRHS